MMPPSVATPSQVEPAATAPLPARSRLGSSTLIGGLTAPPVLSQPPESPPEETQPAAELHTASPVEAPSPTAVAADAASPAAMSPVPVAPAPLVSSAPVATEPVSPALAAAPPVTPLHRPTSATDAPSTLPTEAPPDSSTDLRWSRSRGRALWIALAAGVAAAAVGLVLRNGATSREVSESAAVRTDDAPRSASEEPAPSPAREAPPETSAEAVAPASPSGTTAASDAPSVAAAPSAAASAATPSSDPAPAESAESAPGKTRVSFTSRPPGVRFFHRGKEVGTAPFSIELAPGERRTFEAGMPGYVTRRVVVDGTKPEIKVGLRPEKR